MISLQPISEDSFRLPAKYPSSFCGEVIADGILAMSRKVGEDIVMVSVFSRYLSVQEAPRVGKEREKGKRVKLALL